MNNANHWNTVNTKYMFHGYTVNQQYPTLYFPTNAHNIKKL